MTETVALIAVIIFACMFLFQLLLAFGAPFGNLAWGGKNRILPPKLRINSLFAAVIFIIASIAVLEKVYLISIFNNHLLISILVWLFVFLFGFSTIGNFLSSSKPEKKIMTPVAFILFILCLIVAIGL